MHAVDSLSQLVTVGSHGNAVLLLLSAPWCEECVRVERSMRSAAAQLALLHRAAKLGLADVSTAGGASIFTQLSDAETRKRGLPALLLLSGAGVWQYHGSSEAGALVRRMSKWGAPGLDPPRPLGLRCLALPCLPSSRSPRDGPWPLSSGGPRARSPRSGRSHAPSTASRTARGCQSTAW